MIIYESNKNWFRDVRHLTRSWTMTKIVRSVLAMGLFATCVAVLEIEVLGTREMNLSGNIFSLLGIVLSILLVFRTNTAYDRWWEGRKLWGALVNNTRNLAIMAHITLPESDKGTRKRLAVLISNFCIAMKEHLRGGVKHEELILLSEDDKEVYPAKKHLPSHISRQIHQLVEHHYREGNIKPEDLLNMKPQLESFMDILGACERIKKTPIPFSYNVYLKVFIMAYSLLLPFALVPQLGYLSIPAIMFIFFAFIGVEMMAEEIEDPFGLDCNDLPTGDIAHTIKNNVFEILETEMVKHSEVKEQLYEKIH